MLKCTSLRAAQAMHLSHHPPKHETPNLEYQWQTLPSNVNMSIDETTYAFIYRIPYSCCVCLSKCFRLFHHVSTSPWPNAAPQCSVAKVRKCQWWVAWGRNDWTNQQQTCVELFQWTVKNRSSPRASAESVWIVCPVWSFLVRWQIIQWCIELGGWVLQWFEVYQCFFASVVLCNCGVGPHPHLQIGRSTCNWKKQQTTENRPLARLPA